MNIGRDRSRRASGTRLAALLAAFAIVGSVGAGRAIGRGAAILERFTPETGGFPVAPANPPVFHPNGEFAFAIAGNRLLCTIDAVTGAYVRSTDLGLETFASLEEHPVAPMTISANGRVLALVAAGTARFYDVDGEGVVQARSTVPGVLPVAIRLSGDGRLAVVAVGGAPASVATVSTEDGSVRDSFELEAGEAPIDVLYAPDRRAVSVVTTSGIVFLRHKENGNLSESGRYARPGFTGDAYAGLAALGKRGRVVFTIDSGGTALVGVSLKGRQSGRVPAPLPDRFSAPVAVSPDGSTIVATRASAATGLPAGLLIYRGEGRGFANGAPDAVPFGEGLGEIGTLGFDSAGGVLAVSFPRASTVVLVDVATRREVDRTTAVGSADGFAFAPEGRGLAIAGSPGAEAVTPTGPGAVTFLPVVRRAFDEASAVRFDRVPGVIVRPGDRAASFPNRFYAVTASDAADTLTSYNVTSGGVLDRVALGPSMGFLVVAPDRRTLVVSAGGGLGVFAVDDDGMISQVGPVVPGAIPPALAPCIAFHPSRAIAYVTAELAVWRVDLQSGSIDRFDVGTAGLTNPAVGSGGTRLYALDGVGAIVRCSLDGAGGVSVIDRVPVQATLDPRAPRVAYDPDATTVWMVSGQMVRQVNLATGNTEDLSSNVASGRGIVFVGGRILAVLPENGGPIAYVEVADGGLRLDSEVDAGGDPFGMFGGGSLGVDPAGGRMFLPVTGSGRVVSVTGDGNVVDLDGESVVVHVTFDTPLPRLAYPDLGRFPGSTVVARGF